MWEEIIKLAVGNGLWAVLFCALLFYELKDSRKRESKYVETISSLGEKLDVINSVKEDTEEIISLHKENCKRNEIAGQEMQSRVRRATGGAATRECSKIYSTEPPRRT